MRDKLRVAAIVTENDYLGSDEAAEDAHRVALLASNRDLRRDRETLRVRVTNELNLRRDPAVERVRGAGRLADFASVAALLAIIVSIALMVGANRRSGVPLLEAGEWTLPLGATYLAAIALLAWCEPLRARDEIWYIGWPARGYLLFTAFAVVVLLVVPLTRQRDIWPEQIAMVVLGLGCFAAAGAWAFSLWWRARKAGLVDAMSDRRLPTRGLIDPRDFDEFYVQLDAWWARTALTFERENPERLALLFAETLDVLAGRHLIGGPGQVRRRELSLPQGPWRERRPGATRLS